MSSFDRNIIAKTRQRTGTKNENIVSKTALERELESAKSVISREIAEKLKNGETLQFNDGASKAALENYMFLQVSGIVQNNEIPKSVPRIKQTDFEDTQLNYWRDQLIRSIRDI